MSQTLFTSLNLSSEVMRAVEEMGFDAATEIQAQTIPMIRAGYDVIGRSQTGSGKTVAFGIPAIELVDTEQHKFDPQVLILCPTRELAMQGAGELRKLARYKHGIKIAEIYGGAPMPPQITRLKSGTNIVIGTPGRIMDHLRRRTLKLNHLKMIILDEADEMLSMGFKEDIETILEDVPEQRQTILFSATMPPSIMALTKTYQKDPQLIEVGSRERAVDTIEQSYYDVPMGRKMDALNLLLRYYHPNLSMIFCNTKKMVEELTEYLTKNGFRAEGLHGDMKQGQRTTVLNAFKHGRASIMVATDVAARGIDVDDIDYVFNFDIPQNNEYYIHRIGRTGRAGKDGCAITLCSGRRQVVQLLQIIHMTKSDAHKRFLPTPQEISQKAGEDYLVQIQEKMNLQIPQHSLDLAQQLIERDMDVKQALAALIEMQFGGQLDSLKEVKQDRKETKDGAKRGYGKISISIGRSDRIAPNHIVGALTEKTNMHGKDIGKIEIYDDRSIVAIPLDEMEATVSAMNGSKISGKIVSVRTHQVKDGRSGYSGDRKRKGNPRGSFSDSGKKDYRNLSKKPRAKKYM